MNGSVLFMGLEQAMQDRFWPTTGRVVSGVVRNVVARDVLGDFGGDDIGL